jgi:hypothetical protein
LRVPRRASAEFGWELRMPVRNGMGKWDMCVPVRTVLDWRSMWVQWGTDIS